MTVETKLRHQQARTPRATKKSLGRVVCIRVRAYEHGVLDGAVKQIIDVAARHNAEVVGQCPYLLISKYTVNRALYRQDSREQFEMRIRAW